MNSNKSVQLRICPICPSVNRLFDDRALFQHAVAIYKNNPNCALSRAHIGLISELTERLSESSRPQGAISDKSNTGNGGVAIRVPVHFKGTGIPQNVAQSNPKTTNYSLEVKNSDSHQTKVFVSSQTKGFHCLQTKVSDEDYGCEVVWPWMCVLLNVHNSSDGKAVDESFNADIKKQLHCLNPKMVHTRFSKSHLGGMSVLEFGTDVTGYFDAYDLHTKMLQLGRGKQKWLQVLSERKDPGKEPYGWIAEKSDYHANDVVGELLRKRGHLRSLHWKQILDGNWNEMYKDIRNKIQEKNMRLMEYATENYNLQRKLNQAEKEKSTVEARVMSLEEMHMKEMERNKQLKAQLTDIVKRCNDLEEKFQDDEDYEQKIQDLEEDRELLQDCYEHCIYKERELNDEIQNAKRKAIEILEKQGENGSGLIGIKTVGEIDDKPWRKVCAEKFKDDEEGSSFTKLFSLWESYVKDDSWHPFKSAITGANRLEVDESDEKLVKLREEYGNDVYLTVVNALSERQRYDANGRYSVHIAWNFQQQREATLEEILTHIANMPSKRKRRLEN